ncbi:type II toxin-antitoxin system HicB family antitoxin [Chishuiella sp.]|uniref:type II toxin-antitoxin system HicB family antitoxin n=1 Tax=Chishuiella sp. TaxID=1969467 RepID=UPI0028AFE8CD|nr:type II toxin-antitoxin system HicB family antitoxin [Chishuiella sp.]
MEKIIEVFVEKNEDGTYWGTSQNIPGVISSFGNSLDELQRDFELAFSDYIEVAKELKEPYAEDYENVVFEYKMDMSSFFELVPEIKISSIAKRAEMNESLVRQYKTGKVKASQSQSNKILDAIHELGNELLSVRF